MLSKNIRYIFPLICTFFLPTLLYAQDSLIVVDIYNSTNGDKWVNNDNWLSEKPLNDWYGITVSDSNITAIELPINHLKGKIPDNLCRLSSLEIINLSDNYLAGELPDSIGYLHNLEHIDLSHNNLSGSIGKLFNLNNKLKYLDLSNNHFQGDIPRTINNLKKLQYLKLADNLLSGELPGNLFKNNSISHLDLSSNSFSGTIPRHIGNLIQLQYLDLSRNNFSSEIPKEIGKLINLTDRLALNHNDLSGEIPIELCKLTKLEYLWLNNNKFTGILPFDIGNLIQLKTLFIYQNKFVGPIPNSIGNLRELEIFYAHDNSFGGEIPIELWFLPKLKMLKFENNKLNGSIPGDLRILKSIQAIDLSNNSISTINDTLKLPPSIISFNLTDNRLLCFDSRDTTETFAEIDASIIEKIVGIERQNCSELDLPSFTFQTDNIDFHSIPTDSSLSKYIQITSSNDTTIKILVKNFDTINFIVPDSLIRIEQDDTVSIPIIFSPVEKGIFNDVVLIEDTVNNQDDFILISGEGLDPGLPDRDPTIPWRYKLHPIPFSDGSEISIKYDVPKTSNIDIAIYNLGGRPIRSIIKSSVEIGYHEYIWDATDENGQIVEPSEYLCVMQSGMFIQIQPLLILY